MTRKLKTLGVALVAVFALSAVMASTVSAASYTSSSYPTTVTATSAAGNDVFTTEGGTVECASHFEGTLSEASWALTVTPKYTNCKAFGFVNAEVTGCLYWFRAITTTLTDLDILYPCTIKASTCHVTLPAQQSRASFATTNSVGDVNVQAKVSAITYQVVNDGFLCPFNGTGHKSGGTYNQGSAVTFDAVFPLTASFSVS